jgi:hypothetical protein
MIVANHLARTNYQGKNSSNNKSSTPSKPRVLIQLTDAIVNQNKSLIETSKPNIFFSGGSYCGVFVNFVNLTDTPSNPVSKLVESVVSIDTMYMPPEEKENVSYAIAIKNNYNCSNVKSIGMITSTYEDFSIETVTIYPINKLSIWSDKLQQETQPEQQPTTEI